MLIVKLDYGFRLNLYLGFDIYVVDFDLARPNQKDAQIRRKRVTYTASILIILSQHLVPSNSESPAVPPNFAWGGANKIFFCANAPTPSPQNLHQVSANGDNNKFFSSFDLFQTQCSMANYNTVYKCNR